MKEKVITALLNLIKVKSILTFIAAYLLYDMVHTKQVEPASAMVIITMVFESLYKKKKKVDKGE